MPQFEDVTDDTDQKLLEQYPWNVFKHLPSLMAHNIEIALLKEICANEVTQEHCGKLLRESSFREAFLRCWESGSFAGLRNHAQFPLRKDPLIETDELASCQRVTDGDTIIVDSTFYEVAGDVWNIQYSEDYQRVVASWISHVDHRVTHNAVAKKRSPNTGRWFLDSPEFCQIRNPEPSNRVIWCPGIPGVGKTVIASLSIEFLRRLQGNVFVGFIYFDFKLRSLQDLPFVLNSLCRQVYEAFESNEVTKIFEDMYNRHKKQKTRPTVLETQQALLSAFQLFNRCFLVIDALDEYLDQYNDSKIKELLDTLISLGTHVKLMVTSRFLTGLVNIFEELGSSRREIEGRDEDICRYVEKRLDSQELNFEISSSLREQIIDGIINAAKGRFLMAALNMDLLAEQLNPGDLEDTLCMLPNEEDVAYSRVMERIGSYTGNRGVIARKAILLVAYTSRPLAIEELQHALAAKEGRHDVKKYLTPLSTIAAVCAGILVIRGNHVVFTHFTAQEYFNQEKIRMLHFPSADLDIARICLNYLSLGVLSDDTLVDEFPDEILQYLPFYGYAAWNWGLHCSMSASEDSNDLAPQIWQFLTENHQAVTHCAMYLLWVSKPQMYVPPEYALFFLYTEEKLTSGASLFVSVHHNQISVTRKLLKDARELPTTNNEYWRTPLSFITRTEQIPILEAMVEKFGARIHAARNLSLLHHVVTYGLQGAVELILAQPDTDLHMLIAYKGTLLHAAMKHGHVEIVRLLLAFEASKRRQKSTSQNPVPRLVNIPDINLHTPLSLAFTKSVCSVPLTKLLIEYEGPEFIDQELHSDQTPLMLTLSPDYVSAAGASDQFAVCKLLLEAGAQVNHCNDEGKTLLFLAAKTFDVSILELILEYGGCIALNSTDQEGRSPLSVLAAGRTDWAGAPVGTEEEAELCIALLLQQPDVDINLADRKGCSPLYYAQKAGYTSRVVPLLERHGAQLIPDVATMPPDFLCTASMDGVESVVKLLIEQGGITTEPSNEYGSTPLSQAARYGRAQIVGLLLNEPWVNVNSVDDYGRTPLHHAIMSKNISIIDMLLQHPRFDIQKRDSRPGGAPYLTWVVKDQWANAESIQLLKHVSRYSAIANTVNQQDKDGNTSLFYAAANSWEFLRILLEIPSADISIRNYEGSTALIFACRAEEAYIGVRGPVSGEDAVKAIEQLLEKYLSGINAQDSSGRTPLSWAIWSLEKDLLAKLGHEETWPWYLSLPKEKDVKQKVSALLSRSELDINLPDNEGKTPLWYARQAGFDRVARMLIAKGAHELESE